MITLIYSLNHIVGAHIALIGFLICALVFLAVCCAFKQNRSRRGFRTSLLGLLGAGIVCDAAWFLIYYPGGSYHNYGIGAAGGMLLWPILLCLAGVIVAMINAK